MRKLYPGNTWKKLKNWKRKGKGQRLKAGKFKGETESLIKAGQEQALRTDSVIHAILDVSLYVGYVKRKLAVSHIFSCSQLASHHYRKHQEKVRKNGFCARNLK